MASAAMAKGLLYRPIKSPSAIAQMRHKPKSMVKQVAVFDHGENAPESRGFCSGIENTGLTRMALT